MWTFSLRCPRRSSLLMRLISSFCTLRTVAFLACVEVLSCSEVNPTGFSGATILSGEAVQPDDPTEAAVGGAAGASHDLEGLVLTPCSEDAEELFAHLNLFRQQNGLGPIDSSLSLCFVAEAHVADLHAQEPQPGCTDHSWSAQAPGGACCSPADQSPDECMREAPGRLTGYEGTGYEMVALDAVDIASAFRGFREDPEHRALLLNEGEWATSKWLAVGAASVDGHVSLWLGNASDSSSLEE